MDPNKENNKSWKSVGIKNTYEEAARFVQSYRAGAGHDEQLLIKIKRCGIDGRRFKIKVWHPDFVKPKNNKKRKK